MARPDGSALKTEMQLDGAGVGAGALSVDVPEALLLSARVLLPLPPQAANIKAQKALAVTKAA